MKPFKSWNLQKARFIICKINHIACFGTSTQLLQHYQYLISRKIWEIGNFDNFHTVQVPLSKTTLKSSSSYTVLVASIFSKIKSGLAVLCKWFICLIAVSLKSGTKIPWNQLQENVCNFHTVKFLPMFFCFLNPKSYKSELIVLLPHPIVKIWSEFFKYLCKIPHNSLYSPYHSKALLPRFLKKLSQYSFWRNSWWFFGNKLIFLVKNSRTVLFSCVFILFLFSQRFQISFVKLIQLLAFSRNFWRFLQKCQNNAVIM